MLPRYPRRHPQPPAPNSMHSWAVAQPADVASSDPPTWRRGHATKYGIYNIELLPEGGGGGFMAFIRRIDNQRLHTSGVMSQQAPLSMPPLRTYTMQYNPYAQRSLGQPNYRNQTSYDIDSNTPMGYSRSQTPPGYGPSPAPSSQQISYYQMEEHGQ